MVPGFMTEKEKDYVAECSKRNIGHLKKSIDYSKIFCERRRGKVDIKVDENEARKFTSLFFGRDTRGTTGNQPSFGVGLDSLSPSTKTMFLLETLAGLFTVRKYCNLSEDDLKDNIKLFKTILAMNFNRFVSTGKFFLFLEDYLKSTEDGEKKEVVILLQRTFHLVCDLQKFYAFVNSSVDNMPKISRGELEPGFSSTFLSFQSGIILATALLIQSEELGKVFCETVISEHTTSFIRGRHAWQFLSVLVSLIHNDKQDLIIKKVWPCLLRAIEEDGNNDETEQAQFFLDVVNIDKKNLKKHYRNF